MKDAARYYLNDIINVFPDDCFTCEMRLYASYYDYIDGEKILCVLEMINLDGQKLGKGLEDYCFLATSDLTANTTARQRREDDVADPDTIRSIKLSDMRPLREVEESELGCGLLEHKGATGLLFYHDRTDSFFFDSIEIDSSSIGKDALVISEGKEAEMFKGKGDK